MKKERITQNVIQCNHCKDVIVSCYRHDFKTCKCGTVSVDGGLDYLRRCFKNPDDYTDFSKSETVDVKKEA